VRVKRGGLRMFRTLPILAPAFPNWSSSFIFDSVR
jgi:hypothetical protein